MRWITALSTIAIVLGGCARSHAPGDAPGEIREGRFVGDWLIHQPERGGYAGTVYRFEADGTVYPVASYGDRGLLPLAGYAGGLIYDVCDDPLSWTSPDDRTLVIQSRCEDDAFIPSREETLTFQFGEDRSSNFASAQFEISPPHFYAFGQWKKCEESDPACDQVRDCIEEAGASSVCQRH